MAQQLSRHAATVGQVAWRYHANDERKPILVLVPPTAVAANKKSKKRSKGTPLANSSSLPKKLRFRVVLHFGVASADWIPPLRLVPNRCNLSTSGAHNSSSSLSQLYNQALLEDVPVHERLHQIVLQEEYLHWEDALVLAQIWSLQRGLLRRHDGWTTESLAWMLVYLYRTKLASPRMGALQVVTALWKLLADTNWLGDLLEGTAAAHPRAADTHLSTTIRKAPSEAYVDIRDGPRTRAVLVLPAPGLSAAETVAESALAHLYAQQTKDSPLMADDAPTLVALYERDYHLGPVLLDSTMRHNILGRISPATIRQTQRDARLSLQTLHSNNRPFPGLFMEDARFWTRYDAYLQIPLDEFDFGRSNLWGMDQSDCGDAESIYRGLRHVLGKALGDRVREIQILSTGNGSVRGANAFVLEDSDECPTFAVTGKASNTQRMTPTGGKNIIVGIVVDPDVCFRVVDRGPPADDSESTEAFLQLWGKEKAELRRFKDGAIVHAVVWDDKFVAEGDYIHFLNDDKLQGGIIERIIRHTLSLHFLKHDADVQFSLRNMLSCIDGVQPASDDEVTFNPLVAHRLVMKAFDSLSEFLRENSRPTISIPGTSEMKSKLSMPLAIDAVEALAPCLRYADLFPPVPHPLLGGAPLPGLQRVSSAVQSKPILIQIRFGRSSKWPNDLKAIQAAKTAMLIQMLDGIDTLKKANDSIAKKFGEQPVVNSDYADVAFRGYIFRIMVRADPELRLLQSLFRPTDEALSLLQVLTKRHIVASRHHSTVHAVYTRHASSSFVVRLAQRWIATHLLSNHFSFETIELLVAYVYSSPSSPMEAPATVSAGFLRFLRLLSTHDWKREPLVVDPQNSLSMEVQTIIAKDFETLRGKKGDQGPPMFIVSPSDHGDWKDDEGLGDEAADLPKQQAKGSNKMWVPTYSTSRPEWVVLNRAVALAAKSQAVLQKQLQNFQDDGSWSVIFTEPASSFEKYSVLFRVDPDFHVDSDSSSTAGKRLAVLESKTGAMQSSYTRSMIERYKGPKALQRKLFKNLLNQEHILPEWQPIDAMMGGLVKELGHLGLFFYNHLCPEVVGILWRPGVFSPKSFSASQSEWSRPVVDVDWKSDTLVTVNVSDVLSHATKYTQDIVIEHKVLDSGMKIESTRKRPLEKTEREGDHSDSEEEEMQDQAAEASDSGSHNSSDSEVEDE